jgi:hypothetical protein
MKKNSRDELDSGDRQALELAMATVMDGDDGRRRQIAHLLREQSWIEVAKFAAMNCQMEALRLKPWELPPCEVFSNEMDTEGGKLLQRMVAAGVSKYHPDPLAALRELEGNPSI